MAILVAAGGAALGSAIGVGWQAGWLAGAVVGGLVFGTGGRRTVRGPRLSDLRVTSSAYGAPIPIVYGTVRIGGNIIWSGGIRERKRTETQGGKGGGVRTVSYDYFASFAVGFCEGPARDVLRIWADGKLIYDRTGTGGTVSKPGLRFRFYPGDEDQLPDPAIEAAVGAGNAPAHRGLCYIVFEDLPLADYGNRIPNITAEIAFEASNTQPYTAIDPITTAEGGLFTSYQKSDLAVDWRRGYGFFVVSDPDPNSAGIRRFELRTMKEDRQIRLADALSSAPNGWCGNPHVGPDGYLYLQIGTGNSTPVVRIEPNSLREVARFGTEGPGLDNTTTGFVQPRWMSTVSAWGPEGRADFLLASSTFGDVGLLKSDGLEYVFGAGVEINEPRAAGVVCGKVAEGYGEGWVLGTDTGTSHTSVALYRVRADWNARYDAATGQTYGVTWEKAATIAPGDIESGAAAFYGKAGGLVYDRTDDSLIFHVRISNGGNPGKIYAVKWRPVDGIVWRTEIPYEVNWDGPAFNNSRIEGRYYTILNASRLVSLDTATGEKVRDETWAAINDDGTQSYDGVTDTLVVHDQSMGWVRLFLGRGAGAGASLANIVADLCARAGLAAGDLDTSELTDTVPGYVVARPMPVRDALEPLRQAYLFDAVESDDVVAFRKRGRAPVATLGEQDLIVLDPGTKEVLRERRVQEVELPERVSVVYMDPAQDYSTGTQQAKRPSAPAAAMGSRHHLPVELPLVLDADTAKRIAEKTLYAAWVERAAYEARLLPKWLRLEPTDVVEVQLGGATHRIRITRLDVGADFTLALEGVSEEPATYSSSAQADAGVGGGQMVPGPVETKLILPDLPLLRDQDDTGGAGSRVYFAMAGYGGAGWPGAALYRSADRAVWSHFGRSVNEAAWGVTVNALGAPRSPFATDEANELVVAMVTGEDRLASVTQAQMLNGANAALVLKANGEPEIVQFRDVIPNPDGTFTLQGLLRGRRGTDVFVTGHQPGELFVLLDPLDWETATLALGELGATRFFRAVGLGQLFEDAEIVSMTFTGRDLKPYAPVHGRAVKSGSPPDIVLSWVRRTRIGGELRDGTGEVPLAEASEAYEVDILDGPGGSVKRTLTSTSPTVTYANADVVADFGSVPSQLSFVVYQMSAAVGRGFPGTFTVEVE